MSSRYAAFASAVAGWALLALIVTSVGPFGVGAAPAEIRWETDFGVGGKANLGEIGVGELAVLGADGDTYVAARNGIEVARIDASGALDHAYGSGGVSRVDPARFGGSGSYYTRSMVPLRGGRLLLAGYIFDGESYAKFVLKLRSNGSPDQSFGVRGLARPKGSGRADAGRQDFDAVEALPGGKLLASGTANYRRGLIMRFTKAGKLDSTFGEGGQVLIPTRKRRSSASISSMDVLPSGKIMAAFTGFTGPRLIRLTANGRLDRSFGNGGMVRMDIRTTSPDSTLFASKSGDSLMVVSRLAGFSQVPALIRVDRTGERVSVKTLSRQALSRRLGIAGRTGSVTSAVRIPDGSVLMSTRIGGQPVVFEVGPDGVPDSTFGDQGSFTRPGAERGYAIAGVRDGRVTVSGYEVKDSYAYRLLP